jgi:hypothetical protein|tara:strand:- start:2580 stop:2750 length:171 start_codon:yes stop_codon:yes gene_type:complete
MVSEGGGVAVICNPFGHQVKYNPGMALSVVFSQQDKDNNGFLSFPSMDFQQASPFF